jgi:hypothetical protein
MSRARMYIAGSVLVAVAVGVSIAMFSSGAGATTAATVSANTHAANHNDTTSVSGNATIPSNGGPVWAYDNLKVAITATPAVVGSYSVDLSVIGSFAGFANPRTTDELTAAGLPAVPAPGDALTSSGSVKGTYHLTVNSPTLPKASNLHAQQDPTTGLSDMVRQLFGDVATVNPVDGTVSHTVIVSGGPYSFVYNKVAGVVYAQSG